MRILSENIVGRVVENHAEETGHHKETLIKQSCVTKFREVPCWCPGICIRSSDTHPFATHSASMLVSTYGSCVCQS
eukprot:1189423-Prorocentrum_minimum.AAC.2